MGEAEGKDRPEQCGAFVVKGIFRGIRFQGKIELFLKNRGCKDTCRMFIFLKNMHLKFLGFIICLLFTCLSVHSLYSSSIEKNLAQIKYLAIGALAVVVAQTIGLDKAIRLLFGS